MRGACQSWVPERSGHGGDPCAFGGRQLPAGSLLAGGSVAERAVPSRGVRDTGRWLAALALRRGLTLDIAFGDTPHAAY